MAQESISPAEWQVMRVLWANQACSSSQIIESLSHEYLWKPATIKTLLNRLIQKGWVSRQGEQRPYQYVPSCNEWQHLIEEHQKILDNTCQKKKGAIFYELIKETTLSQKDLQNLQELISHKLTTAPTQVACCCPKGQCSCHIKEEKHS